MIYFSVRPTINRGDYMNYKDYQNSRDLAWEILLRERICKLPVSVSGICRNMGIPIRLYNADDENSGYSTIIDGKPIIFVKSTEKAERQRFTAAHELGHILLGHVGKYKLVNREPSDNDNPIEQAANVFASRLLAPACVLWGCNIRTAEQIAVNCKISVQSAEYRQKRMEILYRRNAFLTSPLERKVYENFREYMKTHRL